MSGVSIDGQEIRKGAGRSNRGPRTQSRRVFPDGVRENVQHVAKSGGTPLVVSRDAKMLGVIELKDIVKGGSRNASPNCARWASRPS